VRATAFDAPDGVAWREAPLHLPSGPVEWERGNCWMGGWETTPAATFAGAGMHMTTTLMTEEEHRRRNAVIGLSVERTEGHRTDPSLSLVPLETF
jgi:hypothetical protein